ncbi:hypothetical protein [Rhodoblastus sp.]|uniref:hypothetical protein n=1 Tax=Rhodoblastus sp. TaxID=1962975 RepID=UPI0025DA992D|nr:hypothetical protein [Rhodoblastus sp.]
MHALLAVVALVVVFLGLRLVFLVVGYTAARAVYAVLFFVRWLMRLFPVATTTPPAALPGNVVQFRRQSTPDKVR